jgi:hypothetical protein
MDEVKNVIDDLISKKSEDLDILFLHLSKLTSPAIISPLYRIFNLSFTKVENCENSSYF